MATTTQDILAERGEQWGDARTTHRRIAEVWSGILNSEVTAHQVALCMTGLKLVRASVNPDEPDSLLDAGGYVEIGKQISEIEAAAPKQQTLASFWNEATEAAVGVKR